MARRQHGRTVVTDSCSTVLHTCCTADADQSLYPDCGDDELTICSPLAMRLVVYILQRPSSKDRCA
jgi:hypothetical protein